MTDEPQDSLLSYQQLWLLVGILVIFSILYQALSLRHSLTHTLDRMEIVQDDLRMVRDSLQHTQQMIEVLLDQSYQRQEDLRAIRKYVVAIDSQYTERKLMHRQKISQLQTVKAQKDKEMLSIKEEASQFDY